MYKQKNILLVAVVIIAGVMSYFYFSGVHSLYKSITSFDDCVASGFTVLTTYPEKCVLPGKVFINKNQQRSDAAPPVASEKKTDAYKNTTYTIGGQIVTLTDGKGILSLDIGSQKSTSSVDIVGDVLYFDVNGDTASDTVLLLSVSNQREQKRFYLATAVALAKGFVGTNGVYLTTNIATSSLRFKNGEINLEYSMTGTTSPVRRYFSLEKNLLKEKRPQNLLNQ